MREERDMEKIKIKYLSDKIERLRYIDGKSDWIDLRAAERVELKKGEFQLIPLGLPCSCHRGLRRYCAAQLDLQELRHHPDEPLRHCG